MTIRPDDLGGRDFEPDPTDPGPVSDGGEVREEALRLMIGLELVPVPEIVRTWEKAAKAMPPSDPEDPDDPSVNLDTLAAIAHAKWHKALALATDLEAAERERATLFTSASEAWQAHADVERDLATAREALRDLLSNLGIPFDDQAERAIDRARDALRSLGEKA